MTGDTTGKSDDTPQPSGGEETTEAQKLPSKVWPGMSLDWKSPVRDVVLHAELPFWLLVPDCNIPVTVQGCILELSITNRAIEIQLGRAYQDSRFNTLLIEKADGAPSKRAAAAIHSTGQNGFILRGARTLISIKTRVLSDAVAAIQDTGRRCVDARFYFTSFVHAHLPFLNKTINAYRRVGTDPFAVEVTEWDVPIWYIDVDEKFVPIGLLPYKNFEGVPVRGALNDVLAGKTEPITFAQPRDLENALNDPEIPGEIDLLDAWSLYYRGRQSDAIRSLITALEVLLEAKLREYLIKQPMSEAEVETRLEKTWNNFQARLTDYVRVSGRRVPGPYISEIPYINGVRLREELDQARNLRHKIVHEGERISYPFQGRMQRVMETMTWLFNWLSEAGPRRNRRLEGDPLKTSMRGVLALDYEYAAAGVVVLESRHMEAHVLLAEDELRRQLVASIEKGSADIEKFAMMVSTKLGFHSLDTPLPEANSPFLFERLILHEGHNFIPLFLWDTHEGLSHEVIERVAARLLALKVQNRTFSLALLVVNSQNGLEWQYRDSAEAITDSAGEVALQCGIAIVSTVDLLLLMNGAEAGYWPVDEVRAGLLRPGRVGIEPPGFRYAGYVRTFFDRAQVASVVVEESAKLRKGDSIVIRLGNRYHHQIIGSMQKDGVEISEAQGGIVGIKTTLRRSEVGVGDYVFVKTDTGEGS